MGAIKGGRIFEKNNFPPSQIRNKSIKPTKKNVRFEELRFFAARLFRRFHIPPPGLAATEGRRRRAGVRRRSAGKR
jgi:hypothetical protein